MQLKGHGQRVLFKNHVTYSLGRKHTKMWAKLYKSNPYKTIKARMNISLPATERGGACMIYFKITKHLEQWVLLCASWVSVTPVHDRTSHQLSAKPPRGHDGMLHMGPGAVSRHRNPRLRKHKTAERELFRKCCHSIYTGDQTHARNSNLKYPKKHSHYKQCLLNHFLKQRDHRIQA